MEEASELRLRATPNQVRRFERLTNRFDHLCEGVEDLGFRCGDCETLVTCVDGLAYPSSCGAGESCQNVSCIVLPGVEGNV